MKADLSHLRAIYAESAARVVPPSVEELEGLIRTLLQYRECYQVGSGLAAVFFPAEDEEWMVEQLGALRLGPAPPGLNERVEREWVKIQDAWASRMTLKAFEEQMRQLLAPVGEAAGQTQQTEKELSQQQERLETLRVLAELLDELVQDAPPNDQGSTAVVDPVGTDTARGTGDDGR